MRTAGVGKKDWSLSGAQSGSYWDVHLEPLQKEGFKVDTWQDFQQGKKIPVSERTWKAREERLQLYLLPSWRQKAGQNDLVKRAWLSPSTSLLPAASIEVTVWDC